MIKLTLFRCHIFYPQRVVDIPDGKPKWTGLDKKSELMDDPDQRCNKRSRMQI